MQNHRLASLAAAVLAACLPRAANAQIDYRNLDDDRPARVEDAYPADRYAFEFLLAYTYAGVKGGGYSHAAVPEIEYGLLRNFQLGLKLPFADVGGSSTSVLGLSGARAFAMYNFNTEGPWLPALSLRLDGYSPVGVNGGSAMRGSVKAIATRSFGTSRIHVNASYGFGGSGRIAAVEGGEAWWYGAALDRTLFRQSVLVVGEVHALRAVSSSPVEVNASVGFRWQWTPTTVLDAGISRGLRRGLGPEWGLTLGLSHAFAVRGLMPRGAPPVPAPTGGSHAPHRH